MSYEPSFLQRAGCWFQHSGIQEAAGGVARYYHADTGNARVSTEITGYAVSTLVYLHARTGDAEYLRRASHAAHFLTRVAWNSEMSAMPFEVGAGAEPLAYFFDCGIIVRGLMSLWRATKEEEWLEAAIRCGEAMARDFAIGGTIHPILALPSKKPIAQDARWSRRPGCYQLKSAMGWHELGAITGDQRYSKWYEDAAVTAVAGHEAFPTGEPGRERIMDRLHAYCYFLEGLLPWGECANVMAAGIGLTAAYLREIAPLFERSDVPAQLLRLRLYADAMNIAPLDRRAAEEEAARTAAFQLDSADPRVRSGFAFGRKAGELLPFVNPVSTAFCAQALEMWRQYQAGEFSGALEELI